MDSGTDNSSAFRAIIVTVLPKPILFGRGMSKKKRNAISLIEDSMDSGTDNSSAVRAVIVTVLPKPILFGRGMPFADESSVY